MKKKVKIRDLTKEQLKDYCANNSCKECPFDSLNCEGKWVDKKEIFSDSFLNQKIEIEVEEPHLSTFQKAVIKRVLEPFNKEKIKYISFKAGSIVGYIQLLIKCENGVTYESLRAAVLKPNWLRFDKYYTLEELEIDYEY